MTSRQLNLIAEIKQFKSAIDKLESLPFQTKESLLEWQATLMKLSLTMAELSKTLL